jgi:hypothetical protein
MGDNKDVYEEESKRGPKKGDKKPGYRSAQVPVISLVRIVDTSRDYCHPDCRFLELEETEGRRGKKVLAWCHLDDDEVIDLGPVRESQRTVDDVVGKVTVSYFARRSGICIFLEGVTRKWMQKHDLEKVFGTR